MKIDFRLQKEAFALIDSSEDVRNAIDTITD